MEPFAMDTDRELLSEDEIIRKKLMHRLKIKAADALKERFVEISQALNLPYESLVFRAQNTLWGSCSEDNQINLNYKLIFLPDDLVRYVMIHELCHTKHHNHSQKFWRLVKSYDPNYFHHRKALREIHHLIPAWFY